MDNFEFEPYEDPETSELEDEDFDDEGELNDRFEFEASMDKEAMDNPFGYGPFVSDDPLVSDQYSHDNPANNVGPYTGPSSYSINTVAPYSGEEDENPAQNVGPYMPPSVKNQMLQQTLQPEEGSKDVRKSYKQWVDQNGWFDGSSNSVYDRIAQAQVMRKRAQLAKDTETEFEIDEQILTLSKVAAELDESNLTDYMDSLPGGTVALEYEDITEGGLVDLSSFISVESSRLFAEAKDYDWDKFTKAGANYWIRERMNVNPGLLRHETDTRKAAIDYVKSKTMVLTDPIRRAEIIDEFVTNVEKSRRQAAFQLEETDKKLVDRVEQQVDQLLRQAREEVDSEPTFSTTKSLTPDVIDGRLNIGEDDGSFLYTAAAASLASLEEDWPNFTTEGAREWFWDKAPQGPMWKHEDSTRRAAKEYALSRTASIHDSALRNEIVRAFCASVEFLRKVYAVKIAKQEVIDEEAQAYEVFDSVFGTEDEIIWQRRTR